jgi:hypothetical protein
MNDEQTRTRFKTHATWRWELMTARERLSSNTLIVLGNLLVVLAYVLMALVWQRELFLVVSALAGAGWTLSAAELWVGPSAQCQARHEAA